MISIPAVFNFLSVHKIGVQIQCRKLLIVHLAQLFQHTVGQCQQLCFVGLQIAPHIRQIVDQLQAGAG